MLATARARAEAEGVANVVFDQGDAQVFPFGDGVSDVALSRFAVTFSADPVAAFANVRRALKPGGRLAFLCMTALAGTDLGTVFGALAPFLPTPTGEDGTGPTAFADPARVRSVLTGAASSMSPATMSRPTRSGELTYPTRRGSSRTGVRSNTTSAR
ncbi:methyltransferase domain-containing protein [Amycolatopsis sp. QT-25]|uniref:methyltransferase domain-containing protein n=1 Tax=Amycolatopsis sp. QT-25 TaxID=3034022 RepID=UPI0023ECF6CB|nr:methyltransferase domain-containing protein [Amycolatopsis sp. QT-25]WET77060.1 methyltransferase domain-containing protein [Amycolatopsis sp. QT-25]